jgi:hypothetical protein
VFRKEREVVQEATVTAKNSINVALLVAGVAIVLAAVAVVISVSRSK